MKVMFLVHQYWPHYQSGTENYTHYLAQALAQLDVDVTVVAAEPLSTGDYRVEQSSEGPVRIWKIHKNIALTGGAFSSLWDPCFEKAFAKLFKNEGPDLLHIQHLMFTSLGIPHWVKKNRSIPILYTLHDFWLECPLIIRLNTRGERCAQWSSETCAHCMEDAQSLLGCSPNSVPLLRRLRSKLPSLTLPKMVRFSAANLKRLFCSFNRLQTQVQKRYEFMRNVCSYVDLFIAPSHFLRDSFLRWGLPSEKVFTSRNGMVRRVYQPPVDKASPRGKEVHFVFTSVVKPEKGILVALEAFDRLWKEGERRARLLVFGKIPDEDGFGRIFRARIENVANAEYRGTFHNKEIGSILESADHLLLPSLWYENAPLVIEEAYLHGIPCVVSDIGGMAERVDHDGNGVHFHVGDAADLAQQVRRLASDPSLGERFRRNLPAVKSIEENAEELLERYRSFLPRS
jgi:glycosyltransferase involved in cell wall biosynthesis